MRNGVIHGGKIESFVRTDFSKRPIFKIIELISNGIVHPRKVTKLNTVIRSMNIDFVIS